MTGRIRSITHHQPIDPPTPPRQAPFTLNPRLLPAWPNLPRLLEHPAGRLATHIAMSAPIAEYDPEETVLAFGSMA